MGLILACMAAVVMVADHAAAQYRAAAADEIIPAVKAHILQETSWLENEVEIVSVGHLAGFQVPSGADVGFRISAKGGFSRSRTHLFPVEMLEKGKPVQTVWITAEIRVRANIVQSAKRLSYGKTIAPDDVTVAPAEIVDLRGSYFRNSEEVVGQALRRTLSPGAPLTREALTGAVLVRSGETVRLCMQGPGISLAAMVRAEQSGRLGQIIRVRSLDYLRTLKAEVTAPGQVKLYQARPGSRN